MTDDNQPPAWPPTGMAADPGELVFAEFVHALRTWRPPAPTPSYPPRKHIARLTRPQETKPHNRCSGGGF